MNDLDTMLRSTAGSIGWPETPDLRPVPSPRRTPRSNRREVLAAGLALVAFVVLVTPAREAVLAFFGVRGVGVEAGMPLNLDQREDLGEEVTLEDAVERTGLPEPQTGDLGRPSDVRLDDAGRIWIVFPDSELIPGGALLTIFDSAQTPALTKRVADPGLQAELVTVNGEPGIWVTGDDHAILFEPATGSAEFTPGRLSDNALAWQAGPLTYRLEANIDLATALRIARSLS